MENLQDIWMTTKPETRSGSGTSGYMRGVMLRGGANSVTHPQEAEVPELKARCSGIMSEHCSRIIIHTAELFPDSKRTRYLLIAINNSIKGLEIYTICNQKLSTVVDVQVTNLFWDPERTPQLLRLEF
jgi:hypothetical protein